MKYKKPVLALCLLCAFSIGSCTIETDIEYTFNNQSSYTVVISLSRAYTTSKPTEDYEPPEYTSSFSVYRGSSTTVYVDSADVDFQWGTSSVSDSSKVYCSTSGSKATFKDN